MSSADQQSEAALGGLIERLLVDPEFRAEFRRDPAGVCAAAGSPGLAAEFGGSGKAMYTYIFGGGHGGWSPQPGYDCSGFVSVVLHAGGYLNEPVDTTILPAQAGIESGPGQFVTIYDRALSGHNGHVIICIDGQFYESGGMKGAWGGGGGVEKIGKPSAGYLATFPRVLHPNGL